MLLSAGCYYLGAWTLEHPSLCSSGGGPLLSHGDLSLGGTGGGVGSSIMQVHERRHSSQVPVIVMSGNPSSIERGVDTVGAHAAKHVSYTLHPPPRHIVLPTTSGFRQLVHHVVRSWVAAREGLTLVLASPYLCALCAFMMLQYVNSSLFYFEKTLVVAAAGQDAAHKTAFFAAVNSASALCILVLQLLVTGGCWGWVGCVVGVGHPCMTQTPNTDAQHPNRPSPPTTHNRSCDDMAIHHHCPALGPLLVDCMHAAHRRCPKPNDSCRCGSDPEAAVV